MEPTSQYVENESSGDAHPVAGETSIKPKLEECIEEIIEIPQADNGLLVGRRFATAHQIRSNRNLYGGAGFVGNALLLHGRLATMALTYSCRR